MRDLSSSQLPIVAYLIEAAGLTWNDALAVEPMADGDMGSLRFSPFDEDRALGAVAAECHFYDADNVLVSAALNVDKQGRPFEIDVWRVDFGKTLRWPSREAIMGGSPNPTFQRTAARPLN